MPACVRSWADHHNLSECISIQKDLLTSYQDDFNKYRRKVPAEVLRKTMSSAAFQLGRKFVYSEVDRNIRQPEIKLSVDMLDKAGVCKRVFATAGNGIPLGAEKNDRIFKMLYLDSGLAMSMLGLMPLNMEQFQDVIWSNKGAIAEQLCGQLMYSTHGRDDDDLFYWQRTGSSNAEVDYLIQKGNHILPVEVKAGTSGSMKSLHVFMESRKLSEAVRLDLNVPSRQDVHVLTTQGNQVSYRLISLPLYLAEYIL